MKLTYRGVDYEHNPLTVELTPEEIGGKYRGATWERRYPRHIPVPQPVAELKYRGVPYHIGDPLDVEAMMHRKQRTGSKTEATVTKRKKLTEDLARTHLVHIQRNLEHRLQVAKEQGNQHLIQLLEEEAKQLA
ncbi:DUF4278 domain-containing protein [Chlorogloeopsis sp. ULAP02]|uniref:DUF4278 domain-containing protein n=1 Tax=Chlorogloeopsis sp. ULAP02 TaxID=3107926 RepID=UPI003136DD46